MARALLIRLPVTGSKTRRKAAGFTLVEIMIVITIVGILAVLATVGYSRYLRHSKIIEGQEGISAIRIAQEDYRAERGSYANIGPNYCPNGGGKSNTKFGWDPNCGGGSGPTWSVLPVHLAGAVQFAYATESGPGPYVAPSNASWVSVASPPTGPWFVVMAKCDLDGDPSVNTELVSMSFSNEIFTRYEGN